MKKNILLITILIIVLAIGGCQQQNSIPAYESQAEETVQLSLEQKLADFEHMYQVLEENYPFFAVNKRMHGVDWLGNKDKYVEMIKQTNTDEEFLVALDSILKDLHNGHTGMVGNSFYKDIKAGCERYKENSKPWLEQLNKPASVKRYVDAGSKTPQQGPASNQSAENIKINNAQVKILEEDKVAYISIATLDSAYIEEDMKFFRPFLESIKRYKALIIDIRQNGGGDENYWARGLAPMLIEKPLRWSNYLIFRGGDFSTEFLQYKMWDDYEKLQPIKDIQGEKLASIPPELLNDYKYYYKSNRVVEPDNPVGFKGKIYLLVDRNVYSSSEAFASFAKATGFATLVGETTGGDGIGFDPLIYSLPNSGYLARFSTVLGLDSRGVCNEEYKTEPDVRVNAKKMNDMDKDYAIQYVLEQYK